MKQRFLLLTVAIFLVLTGVFYYVNLQYPEYDVKALMIANVLMAILSTVSFFLISRQLSGNVQAFVRGVYGATFLKLFVCMIGVVVYALANKPHTHKPTLFILLGIYAIYTVVETLLVSKIARTTK